MKFYELISLFNKVLNNEKIEKAGSPSLRYIILAYKAVIDKIYNEFSDNEAVNDKKIYKLELTDNMTKKLIDLSKTPITKKMADDMKRDRNAILLKQKLLDILGIGTKKANELIEAGLTNLKQIHQKKYMLMLNTDTQLDIIHQPTHGIEYDIIKKLEPKLTNFSTNIKPIITGSFLRKKPKVGDIDILFMSERNGDIDKYLDYLSNTFKNRIWIYANGKDKVSFIFQPSPASDIKYKADIFIANKHNYYTMLLYTTGSKNFNIRMRSQAKKMGLLLNQNGLYKNGKKINSHMDDEKDLFNILDMVYVIPENRF